MKQNTMSEATRVKQLVEKSEDWHMAAAEALRIFTQLTPDGGGK